MMTATKGMIAFRYLLLSSGIATLAIGVHLLVKGEHSEHRYVYPTAAFWGSLFLQWYGAAVIAITTIGWNGYLCFVKTQRQVAAEPGAAPDTGRPRQMYHE